MSSTSTSPGTSLPPTTGLAVVEQAVAFTNAQVLDPTAGLSGTIKPTGMDVGGKELADQAVGMMVQDLRTFLQSMEMILVAAAAKAIEKMLGGPAGGAAAATHVTALMRELPTFAAGISALAGAPRQGPLNDPGQGGKQDGESHDQTNFKRPTSRRAVRRPPGREHSRRD